METPAKQLDQALVAIFLDLEMVRNFPTAEDNHWDYEKGNLDEPSKQWAVEAARRVKAAGGRIHGFVVGKTLEQKNVEWLRELHADGHALGNHTYDHVHLSATSTENIQKRFERSPWLIRGRTVPQVLRENIRLCQSALRTRLDVSPIGFRCPDDFPHGLSMRPDLQQMLVDQGFRWVQSRYPIHPPVPKGQQPSRQLLKSVVDVLPGAQPAVYDSGLIEIPMSPPTDIIAFRVANWTLENYLLSIQLGVEKAIREKLVYVHLFHLGSIAPSDPEFRSIDLLCKLVGDAGDQAKLVTGDQIADFLASS